VAAVESREHRHAVSHLVGRRYAWRGYACPPPPESDVTFQATIEGHGTVGTITVGLDGPGGLKADSIFGNEVAALRRADRRLCEFTQLAVDDKLGGESVIAALFHAAYLFAHRQRGCDTVLLEVNPRHVRYYQRALGCRVLAEERINLRVNAPAVLLGLDLEQVGNRLRAPKPAEPGRSLYARALPPDEEQALLQRLQGLNVANPQMTPLAAAA
jgi:hypothetical protein